MLNRPEILAPAGSMEALKAAINAGADACYVGGSLFSARAFADNFDTNELIEAIDYCHINNVKLYMAVNTLLKNKELQQLVPYIEPFYTEGVDGIIVQDTGVIRVLHREYPDLSLHGSTQMSICSSYGAEFLKNIGLTRFVPARELSLKEIKSIKEKVDIEIETFVHGAMCFAYSGKCLLSSFAGGRSGNRGRCAQPCRKKYCSETIPNEYAMSMKDMCTLSMVPELIDTGIDSFKIEGRMKKPEYVAATVMAYSEVSDAYIDGSLTNELIEHHVKRMTDIYNRGGFSSGYYYMRNGREMLANKRPNHTGTLIGRVTKVAPPDISIKLSEQINKQDIIEIRGSGNAVELTSNVSANKGSVITLKGKDFKLIRQDMLVYRTRNNLLIEDIKNNILDNTKTQDIYGTLYAHIGQPLCLTLYSGYNGISASVCGAIVEKASKNPTSKERIMDKLSKSGGTGMTLYLEADLDKDIFVPVGSLGALRRNAIDALKEAVVASCRRQPEIIGNNDNTENNSPSTLKGCTIYVNTKEQLRKVYNYKIVDNIIIDYNVVKSVDMSAYTDKKLYLALPYIFRKHNEADMKELLFLSGMFDGIMIKNLDELGMLAATDYHGLVILDSFVYSYNDEAVSFYMEQLENVCVISPVELTHEEIHNMSFPSVEKLYGHQPLMITAQCFAGNYGDKCGYNKSAVTSFDDELGNSFYSINHCRECYNVIYNGIPTNNIDISNATKDGLADRNYLLEFTIEDEKQVGEIMDYVTAISDIAVSSNNYKLNNTAPIEKYTRGHYIKGID
jgi:putative protease